MNGAAAAATDPDPSVPARRQPGAVRVHAVVVTFVPNPDDLCVLLAALAPQVAAITVVDNCSPSRPALSWPELPGVAPTVVRLPDNRGIAHAQNVGIADALRTGATHVLLSDQDSCPAPDMVERLLQGLQGAQSAGGAPVAAIGPTTQDKRTHALSFFWRSGDVPSRWSPAPTSQEVVDVEFLIASGTLVVADALRAVGGMRSDYFIDHVDTEWCFRARAAGYRLLGSAAARLQHQLGDKVHKVWLGRMRQVSAHSPLRDYYMFRNTLLMRGDLALSGYWQRHLLWRLVQFAVFFLAWGDSRALRARLMWRGLSDGLHGRSGKLDVDQWRLSPVPATELDPASKR